MPTAHMFNLIVSIFVPLLAGYAVCLILFKKIPFDPLVSFSISFGVGMGIIAQWMLVLSILGITYSRTSICFPLITLSLTCIYYIKKKWRHQRTPGEKLSINANKDSCYPYFLSNSRLRIIVGIAAFFYITFQLYFVFWKSLSVPIHSWDALYVIASKAKCFFYEGSIKFLKNYNLSGYPLQVPLSLTWVALNLGAWDEQLTKIIFPLIFSCCLIIYYDFLCCHTNKWWALLGVVLFLSANFPVHHATIAYRDIFLMYYNLAAILILFTGYARGDDRFFILAGLFAGFAVFTKVEAVGYLFINSLAFLYLLSKMRTCCLRDKTMKLLKFIVPGIGVYLFFHLYKVFHYIGLNQERFRFDFTWRSLARIRIIFERFMENLFLSGNWNILWFLLVISLFACRAKFVKSLPAKFFILILFLYFGFYFVIALFTQNFISIAGSHTYTVLSRLILHFFPLCPLAIIFLNYARSEKQLEKKGIT